MAKCGIINKEIGIICPLSRGACIYQHRVSNECKYAVKYTSVAEYCNRVGQVMPTEEQLNEQRTKLINLVRKSS